MLTYLYIAILIVAVGFAIDVDAPLFLETSDFSHHDGASHGVSESGGHDAAGFDCGSHGGFDGGGHH